MCVYFYSLFIILRFPGGSSMAEQPQETSDKNVEIWKIKKLIKSLEAARGYEKNSIGFL